MTMELETKLMTTILDIALNNCCSYRCDYCISKSTFAPYVKHGGKYIHTNNGPSLKPHNLSNFIRNNFTPREAFVQLSGGEPTLHDAFVPIMHNLMTMGYRPAVCTNASQIRQLSKSEDLDKWDCWWRCSWHPEMRSIEDFGEDIAPLPQEKVLVNYVAHPKRIESGLIKEDLEKLGALGAKREVTCFTGDYHFQKFDKSSKIYEKHATCWSSEDIPARSVNYLSILASGEIMRCHRIKIGDIYVPELKERYPQGEVVCEYANGNTSCSTLQSLTLLGAI